MWAFGGKTTHEHMPFTAAQVRRLAKKKKKSKIQIWRAISQLRNLSYGHVSNVIKGKRKGQPTLDEAWEWLNTLP